MKAVSAFYLTLFLFTIATASRAQSLTFCKSVSKEGQPAGVAQEFVLSKAGVSLFFLFQFGTAKPSAISYDVYKIDKGKEIFSSTLKQLVVPGNNWLAKEVTLYDSGSYRVYVYDEQDKLLAQQGFRLKPATQ